VRNISRLLLAAVISLSFSLGNEVTASYQSFPQEYAPLSSNHHVSSEDDSGYVTIPIDDPIDKPSSPTIELQPVETNKSCFSSLSPAAKHSIIISGIVLGLGAFAAITWFVMGHFCAIDSDVFNCTKPSPR
jgi:hypothetical protein